MAAVVNYISNSLRLLDEMETLTLTRPTSNSVFLSANPATPHRNAQHSTVPGFLAKAYDIFDDPANQDICGWGEDGDTVIIKKFQEFGSLVLTKYFKHGNVASFVRQLNMYGFHKTKQVREIRETVNFLWRDTQVILRSHSHTGSQPRRVQARTLQEREERGSSLNQAQAGFANRSRTSRYFLEGERRGGARNSQA